MPFDEKLAERIRAVLDELPDANPQSRSEMQMFGGLAFLLGGNMAVCASSTGGLMVRADPADLDRLVDSTTAEPMIMRGRPMKGWLILPAESVRTKSQLAKWVTIGAKYTATLPTKR